MASVAGEVKIDSQSTSTYWTGFQELFGCEVSLCQRMLGLLKVLSYATLIIPAIVGVVTCIQQPDPASTSGKTDHVGRRALGAWATDDYLDISPLHALVERRRKGGVIHGNKSFFLVEAMKRFIEFKEQGALKEPLTLHHLKDARAFVLRSDGKSPHYFADFFVSRKPTPEEVCVFQFVSAPWNYVLTSSSRGPLKEFIIHGAGPQVGGGVLSERGFGQEEKMIICAPDAALFAGTEVCQGRDPQPLCIEGAHRVMGIEDGLNGEEALRRATAQQVIHSLRTLKGPMPFNLIALAPPMTETTAEGEVTVHQQTETAVIEDLYNTIYAGLSLAKERTPKGTRCVVHSGKFGCNAFHNNNVRLVLFLHRLAANQLGVDLFMHGCEDLETEQAQADWAFFKKHLSTIPEGNAERSIFGILLNLQGYIRRLT